MTTHPFHRGKTGLALAVAALFSLSVGNTFALSLGRITVQSALGETLRAEVEVPDITAEEAASLKPSIASADAFRAAGLEFNPALGPVQIVMQRRPDGRAFLHISSDRVINDPFVDLVLEVRWSSGRIVRDYTLLFDPPTLRPTPAQPLSPVQISPAPATSPTAPNPSRTIPPGNSIGVPAQALPKASSTSQLTVKPGDSASKIALAVKPASVSLDQMLLSLLRTNPEAFIHNDIDRIKAGALLHIPSEEQSLATPASQASQLLRVQSSDFNRYRQQLAAHVPTKVPEADSRKDSGKVQTLVQENSPASAASDKLTLSKGLAPGQSTEEQIAQNREQLETTKRAEELAKNVADLSKIGPAAQTGVASPSPAVAATPTTAPGFLVGLLQEPWLPAAAASLIALLGIFSFYRIRQRNRSPQVGSPFLSTLEPKPNQARVSGTKPPSVSPPEDSEAVDPLIEADVYLAYGRDRQAEEILREALLAEPQRMVLHQKLLEIYAKRRDLVNFEALAIAAHALPDAPGPHWEKICKLGLTLEPQNPLYQAATPVPASELNNQGPLKFDLSSISLDLHPAPGSTPELTPATVPDKLPRSS